VTTPSRASSRAISAQALAARAPALVPRSELEQVVAEQALAR
jgi:hypothetical protein